MHSRLPALAGDHMHNCNILMHVRMPLTARFTRCAIAFYLLNFAQRIDRIDSIIRHSCIEWARLRFG